MRTALLLAPILITTAQPRAADPFQNIVDASVGKAISAFSEKQLKPDQIAVTLYDLTDPAKIQIASHRGNVRIYPASVVKLFYLVAAHRSLEDGTLHDALELRRGLRDMIVDSSNDATHYVLDAVTGTTSGPELPAAEMTEWENKRNAINRYFQSLAYTNINVNQKPWCEGPYGRERVFLGDKYANRNALTTDATARLLSEIVLGQAVSASRSREMRDLLKRDPFAASTDPDDQAHGFSGSALPPGSKLWSKAGWTSDTRHDAAYLELPTGKKLILVVFTVGHANDREIIPALAKDIFTALR
jgi:beta-lactamase class A